MSGWRLGCGIPWRALSPWRVGAGQRRPQHHVARPDFCNEARAGGRVSGLGAGIPSSLCCGCGSSVLWLRVGQSGPNGVRGLPGELQRTHCDNQCLAYCASVVASTSSASCASSLWSVCCGLSRWLCLHSVASSFCGILPRCSSVRVWSTSCLPLPQHVYPVCRS